MRTQDKKAAERINQSSEKVEYYTPSNIVEAARLTMGGIDLDPASSGAANKTIKADYFYTSSNDGLTLSWHGNVWVNHPFSRSHNKAWVEKMVSEYRLGHAPQLCCITFASTSEAWFQPLLKFPQCYLCPRTNYYLPDGSLLRGVTKGSVVTYMGDRVAEFQNHFAKLGTVKI